MSNIQSYNALIDRFKAFASGHYILKAFSHGQINEADLAKFSLYPFMHVVPADVTYERGTKLFSFQIILADLPRDKEDKTEYQKEVLSDLQRIAEDLIAEITNHRMLFGDLITCQNVSIQPFLEEFHHTLTGWTVSIDLLVPYYWDACSIPAEWNDMFESSTGGTGTILSFEDSIVRDENGIVTLVNDEANPAPNYYYGTNSEGVRGWYLITDEVGLTCQTIGTCQTIIDIESAIDLLQTDVTNLQTDVALKANIADISAVGFSNDYNDLDNLPTIPAAQVNSDWNATSGVAEILNKPTIPTSLPPTGNAGGDLTGTYPDPTVHRVHGIDLQNGTPTSNDVWVYGGSPAKWQHQHLNASQIDNDSSVTGATVKLALEHLDSSKQAALGYTPVPNTRTLTINGTAYDLSADRSWTIASNPGTVTSVSALTIGTTGTDLSSTVANSTSTPVITLNVPTASATNRGALSSTDWSTFNGKFTLPSLTSGSVLFSNGTTIAQSNSQLFWDNTNSRLGIGTSSPTVSLDVNGAVKALTGTTIASFGINTGQITYGATNTSITGFSNQFFIINSAVAGFIQLQAQGASGTVRFQTGASEIARFASTGNLLLNTTTDAGYKLDVNGTARMNSINGGGTSTLGLQSHVGATAAITVQFASSQSATSLDKPIISAIGTFNPTSGSATFAGLSFTATINQTGTATGITRGLYINPTLTAAADFRAIEVASGITVLGASTTAKASLRIPSGTAPTSPVNGDIWFDGTDIKMRIGGVTKTFTLI